MPVSEKNVVTLQPIYIQEQFMVISIDFDGTVVEHRYPKIGEEIPHATETLRKLMEDGHKLVLWTVREGPLLEEAINWCRERGVEFSAINETLRADTNEHSNNTRKIDADIYVDDCNIGGRFDWETVYHMIHDHLDYYQIIREEKRKAQQQQQEMEEQQPKKKRRWFGF